MKKQITMTLALALMASSAFAVNLKQPPRKETPAEKGHTTAGAGVAERFRLSADQTNKLEKLTAALRSVQGVNAQISMMEAESALNSKHIIGVEVKSANSSSRENIQVKILAEQLLNMASSGTDPQKKAASLLFAVLGKTQIDPTKSSENSKAMKLVVEYLEVIKKGETESLTAYSKKMSEILSSLGNSAYLHTILEKLNTEELKKLEDCIRA